VKANTDRARSGFKRFMLITINNRTSCSISLGSLNFSMLRIKPAIKNLAKTSNLIITFHKKIIYMAKNIIFSPTFAAYQKKPYFWRDITDIAADE